MGDLVGPCRPPPLHRVPSSLPSLPSCCRALRHFMLPCTCRALPLALFSAQSAAPLSFVVFLRSSGRQYAVCARTRRSPQAPRMTRYPHDGLDLAVQARACVVPRMPFVPLAVRRLSSPDSSDLRLDDVLDLFFNCSLLLAPLHSPYKIIESCDGDCTRVPPVLIVITEHPLK